MRVAFVVCGLVMAAMLMGEAIDVSDKLASPHQSSVTLAGVNLPGANIGTSPLAFAARAEDDGDAYHVLARHASMLHRSRADYGFPTDVPDEALTRAVQRVCLVCHNDQLRTGNLSLQGFDVAKASEHAETAEKMIVKLRLKMMPPPGIPRPGGDTLVALVERLEQRIDEAAAANPNPWHRFPQLLNRAEYERTIETMFGIQIDASAYLPPETISDNFDNIADVQTVSVSLLEGYMNAADAVARAAIGDPNATPRQQDYWATRSFGQNERVEGAPMGSRGGIVAVHNFPADGEYIFEFTFHHATMGEFVGRPARDEWIELSIDGERVAFMEVDRLGMDEYRGLIMRTEPISVRTGFRKVAAVFVPTHDGPFNDLMSPIELSMTASVGHRISGYTVLPHLRILAIRGPWNVTGVSETDSRRRIFTCRPTSPEEERPCAREIIERIAGEAFRKPADGGTLESLMDLYAQGVEAGGFEVGVRLAIQGILSMPQFIFRFEEQPADVAPAESYPISDQALATKLAYFLWAQPPDDELKAVAAEGRLQDPQVLRTQMWRMLRDSRADALGERFAAQWLKLGRLAVIYPDPKHYTEFDDRLRDAARRETETFFNNLVREDRSLLGVLTAEYTFVNERLARHYGIPGVTGSDFRRVEVTDERRRGLGILGHASVLTLTSHAGRTSPVDRGKWVMEVLLGTVPPPPPPVPALEETAAVDGESGRTLTVRERMEIHRNNPMCMSCHQFIDPLGLPLEHFSPTGRFRAREVEGSGQIDPTGRLWDGTPLETPQQLREAILGFETSFVRNFTNNLMRYALGRRVQYFDQPVVRTISERAKDNDYRMSSFIEGVVMSDQFRLRWAEARVDDDL